jgi:protein-S-isoprenylcysteine O-methyltransferase Ste14
MSRTEELGRLSVTDTWGRDDIEQIYDRSSPNYINRRDPVKSGYTRFLDVKASTASQTQVPQSHADTVTRVGAWLFRHRTAIPVPLGLAILLAPSTLAAGPPALVVAGAAIVAAAEAVRLWSVRHIGAISRTRRDRLGPLVVSGPFALIRNPLYVGNIALWIGFALSARLPWLAPLFAAILFFEYHAIVRWEERLLDERLGDRYREYAGNVPRWVPAINGRARRRLQAPAGAATPGASVFSWRQTLFSERGTLIAIAIGFALLWLKAQVV